MQKKRNVPLEKREPKQTIHPGKSQKKDEEREQTKGQREIKELKQRNCNKAIKRVRIKRNPSTLSQINTDLKSKEVLKESNQNMQAKGENSRKRT
jgi:hypothetical protein